MKKHIKHLILFLILICIDQASKYWVRTDLIKKDSIVIIPDILKLQYHTNTGAVWGMLSGKVTFLSIFTIIVLALIVFLYFKIPEGKKFNVLKLIAVFIMAGAVGNLIDRLFLGHVIDFIYFEIINFPLFNFADSCLTVSSILLFLLAIFYFKDEDFAFLDQVFRRKKAGSTALEGKSGKAAATGSDEEADEDSEADEDLEASEDSEASKDSEASDDMDDEEDMADTDNLSDADELKNEDVSDSRNN